MFHPIPMSQSATAQAKSINLPEQGIRIQLLSRFNLVNSDRYSINNGSSAYSILSFNMNPNYSNFIGTNFILIQSTLLRYQLLLPNSDSFGEYKLKTNAARLTRQQASLRIQEKFQFLFGKYVRNQCYARAFQQCFL